MMEGKAQIDFFEYLSINRKTAFWDMMETLGEWEHFSYHGHRFMQL